MKPIITFFIALSGCFLYVNAQTTISLDVPRVVPVSPTATAMEKYLSYPVDHSTGIPNITIPLYEIVAGEVTIPVSLSYHASGLKPKDASTYAGTGWTLNLEPSVSRQVCGVADDSYYGWFNNPARDYNPAIAGEQDKINYFNQLVDNMRDTQPDKFSYKLANGGGSGYFMYGRDFLSIPRTNDKVEYHSGGGMSITDAQGVRYLFDGEREDVENIITRWMCSSIWAPNNPNNALINFSYTTLPYNHSLGHYYNLNDRVIIKKSQNDPHAADILTEETGGHNWHYAIEHVDGQPEAQLRSVSESQAGVHYPGNTKHISDVMKGVRLDGVNFLGNQMAVSYKTVGSSPYNSEVLDAIEVVDQNGTLVRRIKFYITPYNSKTSLTKLDSVIVSAPGAESRKHTFSYYSTSSVPDNYTKSVDHWGFYNGPEYLTGSSVPSFRETMTFPDVNGWPAGTMTLNFSGANREPNHSSTETGVLSRITDPQGITTTFTYEGNFGAFRDNKKPSNKDYLHPVGGLRIQRIQTLDPGTGKWIRKNYTYGLTRPNITGFKPVWGGGAIRHIVTARDYTSSVKQRNVDANTNAVSSYFLTTYASMPESNISFNGGSSVMYNIVTEIVTNSTDNDFLKTTYYYNAKMHNFEDVLHWDDSDPAGSVQIFLRDQPETILQQIARVLPAHPREPSDDYVNHYTLTNQFYGKLIRKDLFRNNKLASQTEYSYKTEVAWGGNIALDLPHRRIIGNTEDLQLNDVFTIGNYYPAGSPSGVQTSYYLDTETYGALEKETERTYYDSDDGQGVVTTQKIYDYQFNWGDPGSSLKPRHIQTTNSDGTVVIDSLDYLPGYPAILSRHKHMENNSWKESRILFLPNSSLPAKVQSRTDQVPVFRDEIRYNDYDNNGNVTELMGKDGMPVSFIWDEQGQFPLARIENATIQDVYAHWPGIKQIRTELPQARITTFEYKPLHGVVSITDPNNITTRFDYDHYGRLTGSYFLDVKSPSDIRKAILQKYIYKLGN
ncbi:RHS repeat domain-containing protein [Pararcticibacter amylolyticus]|uniref:Sugar-binding protein n=1 Tax=Pararcticibacter amylolyticus TaxID=2173175 RepID=A0A2U2PA30_9SPHI|nr:hypothetical protein [Pararcticibacter amylolyticus]PWG78233.1 hypothetical protein DDR33_23265 [Pararcticibacter amylolyticus]